MHKLITGAATAAMLGATLLATSSATADTTYESTGGYDFASNDSGAWRVRSHPVETATATQTLGAGGVTLSIAPDPNATGTSPGYADSGIIVPVGTVADLFDESGGYLDVAVAESGPDDTTVNLYIDTGGDGEYFSFGSDGGYLRQNGDTIVFDDSTVNSRSDLGASVTDAMKVWAWVGIAGNTAMSATVSAVNDKNLVQPLVAHPKFKHSATKTCGAVSTHVWVTDIPDGAVADPGHYDFKVTVTNRRTDKTVTPDHGRLHPGESSSFVRSFGEDTGPRDVRIFKNGKQVQIVRVATNCH